ncbi:hypothetical protein LguiB_035783 [Lonicera macranthoides]
MLLLMRCLPLQKYSSYFMSELPPRFFLGGGGKFVKMDFDSSHFRTLCVFLC